MKLTTKQLKQMIKEELSGVLYEEKEDIMDLGDFNKIMELLNSEQFDYALELMSYFNLKATKEQWKKALAKILYDKTYGAADSEEGKQIMSNRHPHMGAAKSVWQAFELLSKAKEKWRNKTQDRTKKPRTFLSAVKYVPFMQSHEEFYAFLEKVNWGQQEEGET